jgi:hypothetical protein
VEVEVEMIEFGCRAFLEKENARTEEEGALSMLFSVQGHVT